MQKKYMILVIATLLFCGLGAAYLFVRHENRQNEKIRQINAELQLLDAQLEGMISKNISFPDNTYNYLAIGNSITVHDICNFWWNECGMAASSADEDYFHKLSHQLEERYGNITAHAYNFSVWEITDHDRSETISALNPYLSKNLDLITIQLGENVSDLSDFQDDFAYLLQYISENAPDAQILVIGDFWEKSGRDLMKQNICSGGGISMST